jgi:hypothetical protein
MLAKVKNSYSLSKQINNLIFINTSMQLSNIYKIVIFSYYDGFQL